jgi:ABC-type branched-subunit amino acid transport system substrate-binding protein
MNKLVTGTVVALTASAVLSGCGASTSSGGGDEDGPIKIALIPPSSGALAQYGSDAVKGWKLAVEPVNADGGIDGRKVELIERSTDANPATTLREARAAVTRDGAQFIGAVMTSPEHGALNAQLDGLGALSLSHLGKDDGLVGEQCSANAFHISQTNGMDMNALAAQLAEIPGDKFAVQAVDYVTGHGAAKVFKAAAEAAGKEVVLEQFAPLNTTDFGSYITKLQDSGADALFAAEYGADGVAFVKQAEQFKLSKQIKTVIGFNLVSEPLFPVLGDGIAGYYSNVGYDVNGDNGLNQDFVAAYTAKYDTAPYFVPADAYLAAETLFAGIEKAGSSDPEDVREALSGLSFDSIVGEVTVRAEDNQLLRPTYLGQVEKSGEGLTFKILGEATADQTTPQASSDCKL